MGSSSSARLGRSPPCGPRRAVPLMDVPPWELVIRATTLLASAFALVTMGALWRFRVRTSHPARWLDAYLVAVLAATFADRAFVLWVGMQPGDTLFGTPYAGQLEPFIRALGSSLLVLMLVGFGLMALYHLRARR